MSIPCVVFLIGTSWLGTCNLLTLPGWFICYFVFDFFHLLLTIYGAKDVNEFITGKSMADPNLDPIPNGSHNYGQEPDLNIIQA